ncbi:GntR family transcriptional regulator [Bacillus marinisedimentorum]|uniref:GntR family transcriptional regulator n=1 Tax=Bacillus marinisedimentorum TaxID=1821260 RepID=UPI000871F7F5|nr:GntR family transcriptional regulator [Bacillus marinisedimentorum]
MINKDSPLPIYYQLEEGIKELIENGTWKPGEMIPSERELSLKHGISRMTVRQAVNNLVGDGYLVRKRGKGTFVAVKKIEQALNGLTSFSEDMRSRGMEPGTKLLDFDIIPAPPRIREQLHLAEGEDVFEIKRVRMADNRPMALENMYISRNLLPGLREEILSGSIYEFIEKEKKMKISSGKQVLEASVARKAESEILGIKEGAPVLLIQRNSFLADGTPLEVVKSVYRADRYKFSMDLER